jgi:hypothetical protein
MVPRCVAVPETERETNRRVRYSAILHRGFLKPLVEQDTSNEFVPNVDNRFSIEHLHG